VFCVIPNKPKIRRNTYLTCSKTASGKFLCSNCLINIDNEMLGDHFL